MFTGKLLRISDYAKFISPKFLLIVLDIFSFVYFIELYTLLFYIKMFIKSIYRISTIRISKLSFLSTYLFNIRCSKIPKIQDLEDAEHHFENPKFQNNIQHFQNNKLLVRGSFDGARIFISKIQNNKHQYLFDICYSNLPKIRDFKHFQNIISYSFAVRLMERVFLWRNRIHRSRQLVWRLIRPQKYISP